MQGLAVVARVLLALVFVVSAIRQVMYRANVRIGMAKQGIPWPAELLWVAIAVELAAGVALAVGVATAWAALALIAFTAVSTVAFYRDLTNPDFQVHALKNGAIVGGLIFAAMSAGF